MNEETFEKVVEAPAIALDQTVVQTKKVLDAFGSGLYIKKAKAYWHNLGPGLTTGAADDDPSGIATYSQTGAQYGFNFLWLAAFTFPLMSIVQEMCARIGIVTGQGLAANIRIHFPKWVLYTCTLLLFAANTLNIGADLGAMAKASQLIFPQFNFGVAVITFTVLSLGLQIFTTYERYAKYLKYLALILLSYVFSAINLNLNWGELLQHAVTPTFSFSKDQIFLVCAILGTTISPYLFFWQTSQEVEQQILDGKTTLKLRQEQTSKREIKDMRIDVWSGMFLSNLVMFFIITACAITLYAHGITNINTAEDAAKALEPIAGHGAFLLFALGIIGTGLLAVPVLAGSVSYALSESLGWKMGLYRKLKSAYSFYGVIMLSMFIGLFLNFTGLDPIKVLIYSAVGNGLVAPVILALITIISSKKSVMGPWVNKPLTTAFGWLVTAIMTIVAIFAIMTFF